ncbi:nonribosomal peptide synthetase MxaA [Bradyrhizobium ontarionense]|uniref:Nonribosomal peptide synthetase MxaA n=1 Tax=Bradyrhizobium ontarionense TaxID=2898149 RepID=A0ABY3R6N9_9BRAD|nr:nonribosomal peptide synthetase MxaA [Bradyrhizobium sp. A19]UFZ02682.1 nonribosomal peptide synthetase MxaA [Bradyrhizobium sp. A19]
MQTFIRLIGLAVLVLAALVPISAPAAFAADVPVVKQVTIRTPRDIGYFVGDLIKADITLIVDGDASIDPASLPSPGSVAYWLDIRSVDVKQDTAGGDRRYVLTIIYQNFYDALDVRQQEIPTIPLLFHRGDETASFQVPAWTIGVSPLREVAPPVKSDPKDYLRPDRRAAIIDLSPWIWSLIAALAAAFLCLALVAYNRAWWPFLRRPARTFSQAAHRLRRLRGREDEIAAYLEALEILHRGIDRADDRSVLADDLDLFLQRHAAYRALKDGLGDFFGASRLAFFANDPERARREFSFDRIETLTRKLAVAERAGP